MKLFLNLKQGHSMPPCRAKLVGNCAMFALITSFSLFIPHSTSSGYPCGLSFSM